MGANKNSKIFNDNLAKYEDLGINLVNALQLCLEKKKIDYLSINYRIKSEESFLDKIKRKKYKKPFNEIEDICGIRVICFYQSDVNRIGSVIKKEFEIIETHDKRNVLKFDQFSCRSTHFIVQFKDSWLHAPNYRGLENLKAEIQVRTILMHAWAEIEHKLAYKSHLNIPSQFKRKFFRMSAKLEEADEQFEDLKNAIAKYEKIMIRVPKHIDQINKFENEELNTESMQVFLDIFFPNRKKDIIATAKLVEEFKIFGIELKDLHISFLYVKDYLPLIETELSNFALIPTGWMQVGIARYIMSLTNERYREQRGIPEKFIEIARRWSDLIQFEMGSLENFKKPI